MDADPKGLGARWLDWLLWHNPAYLLSAVVMAIGTRCLLVDGAGLAGDVKLAITTFGVLQVYEWAVGGILLLLDRLRRSPEDKPPLVLVAMLFWTGPLLATIELTLARPALGSCVAVGAGLMACGELRLARRLLGLRLSRLGYAVADLTVVLLVAVPPTLRWLIDSSGLSEVALYYAWWIPAEITLLYLWPRTRSVASGARSVPGRGELLFIAIVIAAAAGHLVAMNYSFCGHARLFYGTPLLMAIAVVALRWMSCDETVEPGCLVAATSLPAVAMTLSMQPFAPAFPVYVLPAFLRDPLVTSLLLGAVVWICAARWLRRISFLHLAFVAVCLAVARWAASDGGGGAAFDTIERLPVAWRWAALYTVVAYLIAVATALRRRGEAVAALWLHWVGLFALTSGGGRGSEMFVGLVAGWSVLATLHIVAIRPVLWLRLLPIVMLTGVNAAYVRVSAVSWIAVSHVVLMIFVLFIVGSLWPWTRYRTVATGLAGGGMLYVAARGLVYAALPPSLLIVAAGFVLLAVGVFVSMTKDRWLGTPPGADDTCASAESSRER